MSVVGDNVVDLLEWRANRRPEPLPADVAAELEAASRVYDALLAQGHELRFELPTGDEPHVRAELRSVEGDLVRPVALAEILGLDGPGPSAA